MTFALSTVTLCTLSKELRDSTVILSESVTTMPRKKKELLPRPGVTERTNLVWLARFINLDLQPLTLEQLGPVLSDIRSIARLAISQRSASFPAWELVPDRSKANADGRAEVYSEWAVRRDLADYQKVLKKAVTELMRDKRTVLHLAISMAYPSIAFEIDHADERPHPIMILQKSNSNEILRGFDLRLLFVLQQAGRDLAICKRQSCSSAFVRSRADKQFCSRDCSAFERVRKWRQKQKQRG